MMIQIKIIKSASRQKGFSLIEVIIYISLLSLLITGIFSSIIGSIHLSMKRPTFTEEDYKLLIHDFHEE